MARGEQKLAVTFGDQRTEVAVCWDADTCASVREKYRTNGGAVDLAQMLAEGATHGSTRENRWFVRAVLKRLELERLPEGLQQAAAQYFERTSSSSTEGTRAVVRDTRAAKHAAGKAAAATPATPARGSTLRQVLEPVLARETRASAAALSTARDRRARRGTERPALTQQPREQQATRPPQPRAVDAAAGRRELGPNAQSKYAELQQQAEAQRQERRELDDEAQRLERMEGRLNARELELADREKRLEAQRAELERAELERKAKG